MEHVNTEEEQSREDRAIVLALGRLQPPPLPLPPLPPMPPMPEAAPTKYLTVTHSILGCILILMTFGGMGYGYMQGVQDKIQAITERMIKVEYQNQISIADRAELHSYLSATNGVMNEMNTRLARIDTTLQAVADRQNVRVK